MKSIVSGLLFLLVLAVSAKPGESYILTGKEKSVFSIFQQDMKAYPEYYEGEDVNSCYGQFKDVNKLDNGRKLKVGEELKFPPTKKSKELMKAEQAVAEESARQAQRKADREAEGSMSIDRSSSANQTISGNSALFGSEKPGAYERELKRKQARKRAVFSFERHWLPTWLYKQDIRSLTKEHMKELVTVARGKVDNDFAQAMKLHRYPEKGLWIIEFEKPAGQEECFFFAVQQVEAGPTTYYALEKGLIFFGAGEESKLLKWRSQWSTTDLGAREYSDLESFLAELTDERSASPKAE